MDIFSFKVNTLTRSGYLSIVPGTSVQYQGESLRLSIYQIQSLPYRKAKFNALSLRKLRTRALDNEGKQQCSGASTSYHGLVTGKDVEKGLQHTADESNGNVINPHRTAYEEIKKVTALNKRSNVTKDMEGIHDMEACGNMNRNSSIDDSDFGHHSSPLEVPRDSIQQESINGYVSDQIEINKQASPLMMANNGLNIIGFLKGKNILITGATGFLAKVLVEKILRVQPDVGKLFLLIKAKDAKHVRERLQNEIVQKSLFEYLQQLLGPGYQDFINRKLIPVVGDLSKDNLGMDIDTLSEIQEKVEIIVNSAASTTFDERYDYAINLNTKGAQRILEFGHSCAHLQLLIHVSTAFVNGQRRGRVMEKPFQIGCSITNEAMNAQTDQLVPDIDMNHELQLIRGKKKEIIEEIESASTCAPTSLELLKLKKRLHQEMKDLGMQRAKIFGWQDTYVFTKAMGEMVVDSTRGQVPVVIIRPSVVESSFKDPFPGWMEGNRMMDPVLILYGKGHLPGFLVDPESVLDVVPVDMVANAMLAAMAKHAKEPGIEVYQVASSVVNPLVFFELARMSKEHFTANPFMDNLGKPLPIPKLELFKDMESFLDAVKISTDSIKEPMSCLTDSKDAIRRHKQLTQKVKEQVAYLASLYQPYTFYRGRFDTSKTQELFASLSIEEKQIFGFDVGQIDWETYIKKIHIPGLRKHVLKGRGSIIEE